MLLIGRQNAFNENKIKNIISMYQIKLLLLLFMFAGCASSLPPRIDSGSVKLESFTPENFYNLLKKKSSAWPKATVNASLSFPKKGLPPFPAMVIAHGSAGPTPQLNQWVQLFNNMGMATIVVDSFGSRGVPSVMADQLLLPETVNVVDSLVALKMLANHPQVDSNKIGIIGFSRGGSAAFRTAFESFRQTVIANDLRFAFHISVYGGCNQVYWSPNISGSSILNLVGEADDYSTAEPCIDLAQKMKNSGAKVETIIYPKAHHAWDSLLPVHYEAKAMTSNRCGVVQWDITKWKIFSQRLNKEINSEDLNDFFASCYTRGVHIGRDEEAYKKSVEDVQAFINRQIQFK